MTGFPARMRRPGLPWSLLVFFLLSCGVAKGQSQENREPQKGLDEDEIVRVRANLVNVDVMVKDKKGKYEAKDMVTRKLVKQEASFVIAQ